MSYILVIDDDPGILQLLRTGLKKSGFEVGYAENAREALQKIHDRKPDIVITDAMMPGMDGYELARELRNIPETKALPIIMLTALQQEQDALKAFRDGVDDFVTKPFSIPVMRARVKALLSRSRRTFMSPVADGLAVSDEKKYVTAHLSTGIHELDQSLEGGIPRGSNVLIIGETGAGKSTLGRRFIAEGLSHNERCMVITLDDDPQMVRRNLGDMLMDRKLQQYEDEDIFRLVDCYSWSRGVIKNEEKFAINGMMELNQLASVISDASMEIGQTISHRLGGRRIIDSISSLFINFELVLVQRFLSQLARTAISYGEVSSLFILEEGAVNEREVNNIKYIMDVVIELKLQEKHLARVTNMKWSKFNRDWVSIEV